MKTAFAASLLSLCLSAQAAADAEQAAIAALPIWLMR